MEHPEDSYVFCASHGRLIDGYLRPKIAGEDFHDVLDVDAYSDHPYDLVRGHKPLLVTGEGDGRVWLFFSPERYVGGGKASARHGGSRTRNRSRTVVGADGKKKGAWHPEKTKHPVKGCTAGGYFRNLTYHETTPSGVIKPGWLMVEYGIEEEHGGGSMVLCKVYKSPRGPGSDVPSRTSGCKRKADVVAHLEAPPTPCLRPRQQTHEEEEDDVLLFADSLERDLSDDHAAPAYQETERQSGAGAPEASVYQGTELVPGGVPQIPQGAGDLTVHDDGTAWLRKIMETDDDEMAVLPPNFNCVGYLFGSDQPPCAAQPEDAARFSCVQMSEQGEPADGDGTGFFFLDFIPEGLVGSSAPGECSGLPSLAYPPKDLAYSEQLLPLSRAV